MVEEMIELLEKYESGEYDYDKLIKRFHERYDIDTVLKVVRDLNN